VSTVIPILEWKHVLNTQVDILTPTPGSRIRSYKSCGISKFYLWMTRFVTFFIFMSFLTAFVQLNSLSTFKMELYSILSITRGDKGYFPSSNLEITFAVNSSRN